MNQINNCVCFVAMVLLCASCGSDSNIQQTSDMPVTDSADPVASPGVTGPKEVVGDTSMPVMNLPDSVADDALAKPMLPERVLLTAEEFDLEVDRLIGRRSALPMSELSAVKIGRFDCQNNKLGSWVVDGWVEVIGQDRLELKVIYTPYGVSVTSEDWEVTSTEPDLSSQVVADGGPHMYDMDMDRTNIVVDGLSAVPEAYQTVVKHMAKDALIAANFEGSRLRLKNRELRSHNVVSSFSIPQAEVNEVFVIDDGVADAEAYDFAEMQFNLRAHDKNPKLWSPIVSIQRVGLKARDLIGWKYLIEYGTYVAIDEVTPRP